MHAICLELFVLGMGYFQYLPPNLLFHVSFQLVFPDNHLKKMIEKTSYFYNGLSHMDNDSDKRRLFFHFSSQKKCCCSCFGLSADEIAENYKSRWAIELFLSG